jgi:hypothetical protein
MPYRFWAEALATAAYLLNRRPCKTTSLISPFQSLYGVPPEYTHLCVFGCLCYPNMTATAPHKLAPRSTRCVFLGYPPDHKGNRCYDLSSRRVITSRYVVFQTSSLLCRNNNLVCHPSPRTSTCPVHQHLPCLLNKLHRVLRNNLRRVPYQQHQCHLL